VAPPYGTHPAGCNGSCKFACNAGFNECDGNPVNGCECYGTCSGASCIPYDSGGGDGGSCTIDAGGCLSEGNDCASGNQCCGCKCITSMCCYPPGSLAPAGMGFYCCSGSCNPVGPVEGGGPQCVCF
jgi:hypothetical protein